MREPHSEHISQMKVTIFVLAILLAQQSLSQSAVLPPVPAGTTCLEFAKKQLSSHFGKCDSDYNAAKWPTVRPKNFDWRSCEADNKANDCVIQGYHLAIQWSTECKLPTTDGVNMSYFRHCSQNVTPNREAMVSLVNAIKGFCNNQGVSQAKSDTCAAYWIESDCYLNFRQLTNASYSLGGNKFYNPKFEIPDAPCERKLNLPEVPKNQKCFDFARQQIGRHMENCSFRSSQRSSSQNCLVNDEQNDCYLDMGQLYMEWSEKCKEPIERFNGIWYFGFPTCPTASKSVTRNAQKVTDIGNKAHQFCRTRAGTGSICEVENKTNSCLNVFSYLSRRVYHLENKKTFQYKLEIKSSPKCEDENKKCIENVRKLASSASKKCHEGWEKRRADSIKASPWNCDHLNTSGSQNDCKNAYNDVIRKSTNKCGIKNQDKIRNMRQWIHYYRGGRGRAMEATRHPTCSWGLKSLWNVTTRPHKTCLEKAEDEVMTNQNQCVLFFERRRFDAKNTNRDNHNLRAVKYSICVLEQYKNILSLEDSCKASPVKYYPQNIEKNLLKKAYETIMSAKIQEDEVSEDGEVIKRPVTMLQWWQLDDEVTREHQQLVSNSLQGFQAFCNDYANKNGATECNKAIAYNKCIKLMDNAAKFWNQVDNKIAAEFSIRELDEVCPTTGSAEKDEQSQNQPGKLIAPQGSGWKAAD